MSTSVSTAPQVVSLIVEYVLLILDFTMVITLHYYINKSGPAVKLAGGVLTESASCLCVSPQYHLWHNAELMWTVFMHDQFIAALC